MKTKLDMLFKIDNKMYLEDFVEIAKNFIENEQDKEAVIRYILSTYNENPLYKDKVFNICTSLNEGHNLLENDTYVEIICNNINSDCKYRTTKSSVIEILTNFDQEIIDRISNRNPLLVFKMLDVFEHATNFVDIRLNPWLRDECGKPLFLSFKNTNTMVKLFNEIDKIATKENIKQIPDFDLIIMTLHIFATSTKNIKINIGLHNFFKKLELTHFEHNNSICWEQLTENENLIKSIHNISGSEDVKISGNSILYTWIYNHLNSKLSSQKETMAAIKNLVDKSPSLLDEGRSVEESIQMKLLENISLEFALPIIKQHKGADFFLGKEGFLKNKINNNMSINSDNLSAICKDNAIPLEFWIGKKESQILFSRAINKNSKQKNDAYNNIFILDSLLHSYDFTHSEPLLKCLLITNYIVGAKKSPEKEKLHIKEILQGNNITSDVIGFLESDYQFAILRSYKEKKDSYKEYITLMEQKILSDTINNTDNNIIKIKTKRL